MLLKKKCDRRKFLKYSLSVAAGGTTLALLSPQLRLGERLLYLLAPPDEKPVKKTIISMGTFITVSVYDKKEEDYNHIIERAFDEFRSVDNLMSTFKEESDVSRINRYGGINRLKVDPMVCEVVETAKTIGDRSSGIFDFTILPLLRAYGFRDNHPRTPEPEVLEEALSLVDYRKVSVDKENNVIGLETTGSQIDLGGIAKGYAVDRAANILRSHGVQKAVINAGGDIFAIGAPDEKEGWLIGIQHPLYPEKIAATVLINDQAIATSGNYENYIVVDDKQYGHLFDPRTGNPSNPVLSATIVAPSAMDADALSTSAFLMGQDNGSRFTQNQECAEGIFITKKSDRKIDFKTTDNFPKFEVV